MIWSLVFILHSGSSHSSLTNFGLCFLLGVDRRPTGAQRRFKHAPELPMGPLLLHLPGEQRHLLPAVPQSFASAFTCDPKCMFLCQADVFFPVGS